MRFFIAFYLSATLALGAEDAPQILHRIGQTVADAIGKSSNYLCVQDLSRSYYSAVSADKACRQPPAPPSTSLRVEDRLKLDVAVSGGGEIYSWHGEGKFSSTAVNDVVREGPISSGSFNGYLRNIFGERGVVYTFKGRTRIDDINLFLFEYKVPLASSHYQVQAGKAFELAPFYGSFTARTDSYELYSLTVTAEGNRLSSKANICAAQTSLTYQLIKIGDHESLLPASFNLTMANRTGVSTESKGRYSSCREFKGESVVKFNLDDAAQTATAVQLQTEPLSPGLVLPIAILTEMDEDTAYAGLPVEAVLKHDVKIRKDLRINRGAILKGTLTGFRIIHEPAHQVSLTIEFNTITDGTKLYLCRADHYSIPGFIQSNINTRGRGPFGRGPSSSSTYDDDDSSLLFPVKHLHLRKNYAAEFITVANSETDGR